MIPCECWPPPAPVFGLVWHRGRRPMRGRAHSPVSVSSLLFVNMLGCVFAVAVVAPKAACEPPPDPARQPAAGPAQRRQAGRPGRARGATACPRAQAHVRRRRRGDAGVFVGGVFGVTGAPLGPRPGGAPATTPPPRRRGGAAAHRGGPGSRRRREAAGLGSQEKPSERLEKVGVHLHRRRGRGDANSVVAGKT